MLNSNQHSREERNKLCAVLQLPLPSDKRVKRIAGLGLLAAIGSLALAPLTGGANALAAGPAIYGLTVTGSAAALTASTAALSILAT